MTHPQAPVTKQSDRIRQLTESRQRILSLPAEQTLAAILNHPQPAALVHSFPEEDLHFLIHDIGQGNALPLIGLASNRQWEFMLDMETWTGDRLNYKLATEWLQLLLEADPNRLVKWCLDEKLEFLELYLFRNIELRVRESEQVASDYGDGFFSDDDTYYVQLLDYPVTTPKEEAVKAQRNEMIGHLLHRLSVYDHLRYQGLLTEAMAVIPSEIEEELFRLRNVRLAEKGFLPFHEAVGVYQPPGAGDLAAGGKKAIFWPPGDDSQFPVPQFTATFLEGDNLFVRALKGVGESHVIQQLQVELASLCNQVISADKKLIRGRDQLKGVVAKVSGYLSIGLAQMTADITGDRESEAALLLRRHLLADIFRTGFASALQLKWQAARWRKDSWYQSQKIDLIFWDEAWLGLLGGLLIDRPQYYDPSHAGSNYRDFQTQAEIEATARGLNRVMALDRMLKHMDVPISMLAETRLLTYKNLLLTLWARASLKLPPMDEETSTIAISLAPFKALYQTLWVNDDGLLMIGDEKKTAFLQWAAEASGLAIDELSHSLGRVFEALFDELEHELAPVEAGNLDPRHVHLFLLKP